MKTYRVSLELIEYTEGGTEIMLERRTTNEGTEEEARKVFQKMYDAGEIAP